MEIIIEGRFIKAKKARTKYNFPIIHIMKSGTSYFCALNDAAKEMVEPVQIDWFKSEDKQYILFFQIQAPDAFRPHFFKGKFRGYAIPKEYINDGIVKPGHYKLERYKSGFCFVPYKRIEKD